MSVDYSGFAFPKGQPRVLARHRKRVDAEAALRQAYADVDLRDGGFYWVTGRYTQSGAVDPRVRREHHHLVSRSRSRGRRADVHNIITCTAEAHALIEAGLIHVQGTDARKRLVFTWNGVAPKDRPFHIKSKRRSQNRDDA